MPNFSFLFKAEGVLSCFIIGFVFTTNTQIKYEYNRNQTGRNMRNLDSPSFYDLTHILIHVMFRKLLPASEEEIVTKPNILHD